MTGQILGDRYIVRQCLGQNAGRWTLLAQDQSTQTPVVIKLLRLDEHLDWDDLRLFEREVEMLRSLSHPAIPRYLDFFEQQLSDTKAIALVRTYVDGKSLGQILHQGTPLTEAKAIQLAKALLKVLVYLHAQQPPVIHRDIKPSNILVAEHRIHLVDFGSVRADAPRHSDEFTVVGTYGYMPPEQFLGRAVLASDLYSLGMTLVALLTATQPSNFPHQRGRLDLGQMSHLSPGFIEWLQWLTEMNLELRAKSAQAALQALEGGQQASGALPVAKPAVSQIVLHQDGRSLEILMPSTWGQTRLHIDAQTIELATKHLGVTTGRSLTADRATLKQLDYRPAAAPPGHRSESQPHARLTLWAGPQAFELGEHPPLTPEELDWLAYELSAWLNLPLRHVA
jgi:serine/threonine protein kinase